MLAHRLAAAAFAAALSTGIASPTLAITLTPEVTFLSPFDFGQVEIGSTKTQLFTATPSEPGYDVTTAWRLNSPSSPFSLVSNTCNVSGDPTNDSCAFELAFTPTSAVESTTFLTLEHFYRESTGGTGITEATYFFKGTGVPAVVVPNPIPLPAAAWLLLGGLGALGAVARRKRAA